MRLALLAAVASWSAVALAPQATLVDVDASAASFVSEAMQATGQVDMRTDAAAMWAFGAFSAQLESPELVVHAYRYRLHVVHTPLFRFEYNEDPVVETYRFRDARAHVTGTDTGQAYLIVDDGAASVDLGSVEGLPLFAVSTTWKFLNGATSHGIDGPLLGLKQDPYGRFVDMQGYQGETGRPISERDQSFEFPQARIGVIRTEGAPNLTIDRARLVVEHAEGRTELVAGAEGIRTPAASEVVVTTLVILPSPSEGVVDVSEASAVLVARAFDVHVNGTLLLEAATGSVATNASSRPLQDDRLELLGDLTYRASATQTSGLLGPEARVAAATDGSFEARVNGAALVEEKPAWMAPRTRTLLEVVAAGAALVWTLGHRVMIGLLIRDPLAHARRGAIVEALHRRQFAHVRSIQRETGLPIATVAYHLAILRRLGVVRAVRRENRLVYFLPIGLAPTSEMPALAILAFDTTRRVADAVTRSRGGVTQAELARELGLDRSTASRQLRRLTRAGLVFPRPGPEVTYQAAPLLETALRGR
jgi:DNA-binding transcriptional ArsR family regulator